MQTKTVWKQNLHNAIIFVVFELDPGSRIACGVKFLCLPSLSVVVTDTVRQTGWLCDFRKKLEAFSICSFWQTDSLDDRCHSDRTASWPGFMPRYPIKISQYSVMMDWSCIPLVKILCFPNEELPFDVVQKTVQLEWLVYSEWGSPVWVEVLRKITNCIFLEELKKYFKKGHKVWSR